LLSAPENAPSAQESNHHVRLLEWIMPKAPSSGKTLTGHPADDRAEPGAGGALDRFDVAILRALQEDARLSNVELAARIGLSPAPTWRRVRRLEALGYITGYRAVIDRRKVGLGVLAFVRLDAERHAGDATRALEVAIAQMPEVISCHYISGTGTFELQVMATDLDAFSRFAVETLLNLPHVKDLHTSFSLGEVKTASALPLGHLEGQFSEPRR
jgi:DNA-binding Lrp family transcriptional regulator